MSKTVLEPVHLQKLCVGVPSLEVLRRWQSANRRHWPEGCVVHVTRMRPKRVVPGNGASLFWIIKGQILARQEILRCEEVEDAQGKRMCAIVLDARLVPTTPVPRRAFQGWRYLASSDAPPDLPVGRAGEDTLPPGLAQRLAEMGVR